jgi:hypothetical protein
MIRHQLLEMVLDPHAAYDQPDSDLEPLQLRAAQELFEERRTQIPLLARRAEEAGITHIGSLADIVPLLFAHTVYKSYPPSFVEKGQWDRLLQWLGTLSVAEVTNVNVEGVKDVDDWIARLWDAGHMVLATSALLASALPESHARRFELKKGTFATRWMALREGQCRSHGVLARPDQGAQQRVRGGQLQLRELRPAWGDPCPQR